MSGLWYDNFSYHVPDYVSLLAFWIILWPDAAWLLHSMHVLMINDRWSCSDFIWKITCLEEMCEEIMNNVILLAYEFIHLGELLPSVCISAASCLVDQIWFMPCQVWIEIELLSIFRHKDHADRPLYVHPIAATNCWIPEIRCQHFHICLHARGLWLWSYINKYSYFIICHILHEDEERICLEIDHPKPDHVSCGSPIRSTKNRSGKH